MNCPTCETANTKKHGQDRKGHQRYRCLACGKTFSEIQPRLVGNMTLAEDKALLCLKLLVEGNSIRSTERITGVEKKTILSLLVTVGENCERMMETMIQGVSVNHVQCDEIWGFVGMKEKTRKGKEGAEDTLGDAWCFVGMDTDTKLILAWHLGRRTAEDTVAFTEKLAAATPDHSFQISTDGFTAYKDAVVLSLGSKRVDFAQVVKIYGIPEGDEKRYSPSEVLETKKTVIFGKPDLRIAGTSHIERQNLTIRMSMRRMTRLTNAFSKKWRNLKASYALHFAYYNFCRVHSTIKCTPGMEAGLTKTIWSLKDLVEISGAYAE